MPAYKDSKTGTWFVKFYCKDWTGENKQIKKRGYATKREALDYERNYKIRQENNLDMTFGEFWKLYTEDVKNYVKLNTWLTKEHIVDTKILPYFRNLKMNEITPGDVRKWQNEMVAFRYENGKCYSQTYKKTMHNILSAIFNHACRFYNLKSNPARQAGNMGREEKKEMLFWTTEEYKKFSEAVIDKPVSFYAFEMLYWTGMRLGELLALTMEDFDFEKNTVRINKSYQRLQGQDVITTPKTPKSNRTIKLPKFLAEEMQEYFAMLYDQTPTDRIFLVTKSFLHHEMERGCKLSGVKKIRIHDLRHSHISHLIDLGFSAVAIADRVGHESMSYEKSISDDDIRIAKICKYAKKYKIGVVLTSFTKGNKQPQNSAFVINKSGDILMKYSKVHTCDFADERNVESGKEFKVCDFEGIKLGIMICYDREFPESARILMLKGAEVILVPNDCGSMQPRIRALSTRAYENMVAVAMANPNGDNAGCSCAYSPICWDRNGKCVDNTVLLADDKTEGIFYAEFDMEAIREYRNREMLGNTFRKVESYSRLLSKEIKEPFIRDGQNG